MGMPAADMLRRGSGPDRRADASKTHIPEMARLFPPAVGLLRERCMNVLIARCPLRVWRRRVSHLFPEARTDACCTRNSVDPSGPRGFAVRPS